MRDTGILIHSAVRGLKRIFRPGLAYQKAGIMLLDLVPGDLGQKLLFDEDSGRADRSGRLMEVLDWINQRHGRHAIRYAGEALSGGWHMRQLRKAPAYPLAGSPPGAGRVASGLAQPAGPEA